ncbi:MAG: hypothetical protein FWE88_05840 [Phycisphaerae bacterium]|nr:hypothetical protein [Phycisphaerae bacterium]
MKTTWSIFVCAMVLIPFSASAADAPLADKLPGSTLVYAGWAGAQNDAFAESMVGQLFREPAVAKIWDAVQKAAEQASGGATNAGFTMAEFLANHPAAIALTEFVFDDKLIKAVLVIDLGKDKETFADALDTLLGMTPLAEYSTETTIGGQKFMTFSPFFDATFAWGYEGNLFIVGLNGAEKDVLGIKPAASLAANKSFAAAMKAVAAGPAQVAYYADVERLMPQLLAWEKMLVNDENSWMDDRSDMPRREPKVAKALAALGLDNVTALAGATTIADKGLLSRCKMFSPAPHKGLLAMFNGKPLTKAELASLPGDSDFAAMCRMDAATTLARVREIITAINADAGEQFDEALAAIGKETGVDIEKDLLGSLGDTWTLTMASSQGGLFTGTCATVSIKDAKTLQDSVVKILKAFSGQAIETTAIPAHIRNDTNVIEIERHMRVESAQFGDMTVQYVAGCDFVAPAWGIYKDRLYIALWPQVVASAARVNGEDPGKLTDNKTFAAALARMNQKPMSVSYVNLPQLARTFYGIGMAGWTKGANEFNRSVGRGLNMDIGFTPAAFPTLGQIEKYLWPAVSSVSLDNGGLMFESYSSIPTLGILDVAGAMPLLATAAVPALVSVRGQAQEAGSATNLHNIGMGIAIYCASNDDNLPPDFDALIEEGYVNGKMLFDPVTGEKYIYVGPLVPDRGGPFILAHENPKGRKTVRALRRDFAVLNYTIEEFNRELQKTYKAIENR